MRSPVRNLASIFFALGVCGLLSAQQIELWVDGEPAMGWSFPNPEHPFAAEIRLAAGSAPLQGIEASLFISALLEVMSITTYNGAANLGEFVTFPNVPGGLQQIRIPDFGECIETTESQTLVSILLRFTRSRDLCTYLSLTGLDEQSALNAWRCDSSTVEIYPYYGETSLWCPDAISQRSVGALKSAF